MGDGGEGGDGVSRFGGEEGRVGGTRWVNKRSNFRWVCSSRICNSERACSRTAIRSLCMVSDGAVLGVGFPATSEGESKTGKYTERTESELSERGLRNVAMMDLSGMGLAL